MRDFEAEHRFIFPSDFKEVIFKYGSGTFGDFIDLMNPFRMMNGTSEYLLVERRIRSTYLDMRLEFSHYHPFEYYPNLNGILPWGTTRNGDELFWYAMHSDPNLWQVIVWQSRDPCYWLYPVGIAEFLGRVFSNKIVCPAFGYMGKKKTFTPLASM